MRRDPRGRARPQEEDASDHQSNRQGRPGDGRRARTRARDDLGLGGSRRGCRGRRWRREHEQRRVLHQRHALGRALGLGRERANAQARETLLGAIVSLRLWAVAAVLARASGRDLGAQACEWSERALGAAIPFGRHLPTGMLPVALAQSAPQMLDFPGKEKGLIVLGDRPLVAETPEHMLDDDTTPTERFFIRNNGQTPEQLADKIFELDKEVREPIFECDFTQILKSDSMISAGSNYLSLMKERNGFVCPTCGKPNLLSKGFRYTTTGAYQRYQCRDCGSWSQGSKQLRESVGVKPL